MPVEVSLSNRVDYPIDQLTKLAEKMLDTVDMSMSELSILLTDDAFIQPLNMEWRQVDAPTDVLSFPQGDSPEFPDGPAHLLGDVVISIERATAQAEDLGHDLPTELSVLLAHGLAHLLGYEHHSTVEQERMRQIERQLLGIGLTGLVERQGEEG
ncbi:MAG: rRNA maturation RNase YbeY [Proteobacteria bacterium]|nr:rRNA maturation RNase YbeY [Pseudomonadota bacterium]